MLVAAGGIAAVFTSYLSPNHLLDALTLTGFCG